jgi:uncharacterized cupin superfamily protein
MPKLDLDSIEQLNRTGYPPPFNQEVAGRWYRRLAPASGLTDFGVSHVVLKPGAWSSQRHWHDHVDEFVVMLEGEAVLVEDEGRTTLRAGDCAAWPKGTTNGHHLRNESGEDCVFLVVGAFGLGGGSGGYSDIDMMWTEDGRFVRKDGTPYGEAKAASAT